MAQTGYTPISIYYSSTATNVPTAGNLVAGELAINTADGLLFYKDSSGVVQTIASKSGASGSFANLAYTGTLTGGTGVIAIGTNQIYKDSSGNVGIGTASPTAKLHTVGSVSNIGATFDKGATTQYGINYKNSAQTYTQYVDINNNGTNYWTLYDATNSQIVTQYVPGASGSNAFYTVGTERMRIDSSGNLSLSGAGKIIFSNTPPAISIDSTNSTVTVTNTNYIDFVAFSGTLMLTETNFLGGSAILLAGGAGSTTVVAQTNGTAYTNNSAVGSVRWFYNSGTNAIRLQNNSGSTLVFNILVVKTRNSI
jgi:hypothetical protein